MIKSRILIKRDKSAELKRRPLKPTETKIKNLLKILSLTLKLKFLFNVKLIITPIVTLIILANK
jgi:hypothetical protein